MPDFSNMSFKKSKQNASEEFIKERLSMGESPFTVTQRARFLTIREKYHKEYLPLLANLSRRLLTSTGRARKGQTEVVERIRNVVRVIGEVTDQADALAESKVTFTSVDDIKKTTDTFSNNLKVVEVEVMRIIKDARTNLTLEREIKKAQAETDVKLEEIEKTSQLASVVIKRVAPEIKRELTPAEQVGKGLAVKAAGAFLGPFAGMAQAAAQTITGIVKREKEARIARQEAQFAGIKLAEQAPESFVEQRAEKLKTRGAPLGGGLRETQQRGPKAKETQQQVAQPKVYAGGEEIDVGTLPPQVQETLRAGMERPTMPEEVPATPIKEKAAPVGGKKGFGLGGGIAAGGLVVALLQFFNKEAYQAKWTRDVLKALQTRAAGGGGGGLMDWVGNLLGAGKKGVLGAVGVGKGLLGGYGMLGGAAGIGGVLAGLAKGGLWGGLIKGGAGLLGASKLASAIPMIGKFAGVLGKFAGPIGWALTAVQAGIGAFKGVKAAGKIFGTEKATLGQKAAAGFGGAVESLSFGLLKKENVAKFTHTLAKSIGESFKEGNIWQKALMVMAPGAALGLGAKKMWEKSQQRKATEKALAAEGEATKQFLRGTPAGVLAMTPVERARGRKYEVVGRGEQVSQAISTKATTPVAQAIATEKQVERDLTPEVKESIRQTVEKIPASNEVAKIPGHLQSMTAKLDDGLRKVSEAVNSTKQMGSIVTKRSSETHGMKDPILEMLNSGSLGVAT